MVGIDTVILTLPIKDCVIMEQSRFTPHAATILTARHSTLGRGGYLEAKRNPTKEENREAGYLPYLTVYTAIRTGGLGTYLRIQFSFPKLWSGNNIDEPLEEYFLPCLEKVHKGLAFYGIRIFGGIETLINAPVSTIHYGKNITLPNLMTTHQVINEINKCNVTTWKDVENARYENDEYGYGWKTHSKFHELAFYDKWAEYSEGKKGKPVFDTDLQLAFDFDQSNINTRIELIRMEARLNSPKMIKWALSKAGMPVDDLSFKTLFSKKYSQAILLRHLADLYKSYPKITESQSNNLSTLLGDLYFQNRNRQLRTIVQAVGVYALLKESGIGMRDLKSIVGQKGTEQFNRLIRETNKLDYHSEKSEVFSTLESALTEFKPLTLRSLEK